MAETAADPPSADGLRNLATDYARARRWSDLLALEPGLRADREYWTSWWGAVCAVASWHEGRGDARELLEECIAGGFHDLVPFGTMFDDSFGTEPDWPGLLARIRANVPRAPVELVRWPCARPILPLGLSMLDADGEALLAARLPEPRAGALATAEMLLGWATGRWRHSGANHDPSGDANVVLDRVERGERFACVEYTTVLTQALNAVRIPARPVSLFRPDYHAGIGTGHAVTEAWVDDLGKWALLDGQNGAIWRDADGVPLGALQLHRRYLAGDRPEFSGSGPNFDADDAGEWFTYFHAFAVTGTLAWSAGSYVPIMEVSRVIGSQRLADTDADLAPDLAAIGTGVADHGGAAVVFHADHPYAAGFVVTDADGTATALDPGQPLPLAGAPGEHSLTVAIRTRYGLLAPQPLHYVIR
jgi:hypothetical protein